MVVIGISKKPSTGEYRVYWKENGKDSEAKAYYTDYPIDAVETLFDIETRSQLAGIPVRVSDDRVTSFLISKYASSFGGNR